MNLFAGKSPTERNKIIAAIVLGVMSLAALWFAFGGSLFSGTKTKVTVSASPTPKSSVTPINANLDPVTMPSEDEMDKSYAGTPVNYIAGKFYAPDAGRNIFAFYEPPPPTPYIQTPTPTPKPPPPEKPTPLPTPFPYLVSFVQPQLVYAGSKGFRLEVSGDKFTPETHIFFNGSELPTTFVSPQKLTADVPANFISGEGGRAIIVQTPDGKTSNIAQLTVQAAPRPTFQYIGMISRRHSNNDTAYFQEQGKNAPSGARLNDMIGGRFRVVSIASNETVLEDSTLGFRYKLPLYRPAPGQAGNNGVPNNGNGFSLPYQQNIPGIPQQYIPQPQPQQTPADVDDNDNGPN